MAVPTSSTPNTRNMNENVEINTAPSAMKIARMTSAARIPNVSTRCWCSVGTANVAIAFGVVFGFIAGWDFGAQYFAGYVVEKSLSVDNLCGRRDRRRAAGRHQGERDS